VLSCGGVDLAAGVEEVGGHGDVDPRLHVVEYFIGYVRNLIEGFGKVTAGGFSSWGRH